MEEFFECLLIEGGPGVVEAAKQEVLLGAEGFDSEFLEDEPTGLAAQGFDGGEAGAVAGHVEGDDGGRGGEGLAGGEHPIAERMSEAVNKLGRDGGLGIGVAPVTRRLGDQVVRAGLQAGNGRRIETEGVAGIVERGVIAE